MNNILNGSVITTTTTTSKCLKTGGGGNSKMRLPKTLRPQRRRPRRRKLPDLVLPASKLKFGAVQLQNLNFIFAQKLSRLEADSSRAIQDKSRCLAKSVSERLIQHLVCGAGFLDSRFCSKFLVNLNDGTNTASNNFLDYLVRIDALSIPTLQPRRPQYEVIENDPDFPAGYARVRLQADLLDTWAEFCNNAGYLRRDKVQARFVQLLAAAAKRDSPTPGSPLDVDEATLCASPGKVLGAHALHRMLQMPPAHHVYYGASGNCPRYPDARDFKLAIVDDPDGIKVRIEFLSPALTSLAINVRILVAIGVDAWPASAQFPARVPLVHSDAMLYQTSALTGMYLVGYGVQSSAWHMRVPAAEYCLLNNYSSNSSVRQILHILFSIFDEMGNKTRIKYQAHHIVSKYLLKSALFYDLEFDLSSPTEVAINWSPLFLSTHVLKILDTFVQTVRKQSFPHYFFNKVNLLSNPGHLCEEDYIMESNRIYTYVLKLYDMSLTSTLGNPEFDRFLSDQDMEMLLLYKWRELIDGLLPKNSRRARRLGFISMNLNSEHISPGQYTEKQLEYIVLLLKNVLKVKQVTLEKNMNYCEDFGLSEFQKACIEDLIYILSALINDAKDLFFKTNKIPNIHKSLKLCNESFTKLLDIMRTDKELLEVNLEDDSIFVKTILKCLYKTLGYNRKQLGSIMKQYLKKLFTTSHAISWHLDSIYKRDVEDELNALGIFADLINSKKISPALGLVDAVNKNWIWAKDMLDMVQNQQLRLVFVDNGGNVSRHLLSAPTTNGNSKTVDRTRSVGSFDLDNARRKCFTSLIKSATNEKDANVLPKHCQLQSKSCFTAILEKLHRKGDHRCAGEILGTLLTMQKMNIVQELSTFLPNKDQLKVLATMQKLCTESKGSTSQRKRATISAAFNRDNIVQRYTKNCLEDVAKSSGRNAANLNKESSLIGSCRAARLRLEQDDYIMDNFFKSLQRNIKLM